MILQTEIFSEWCYVSSNHHSITLVHSMWMFYTKEHSGFLSKRDLHFEIQYKIFLHLHINIRFQDVLLVHIHDDDHILFWSWTNTLFDKIYYKCSYMLIINYVQMLLCKFLAFWACIWQSVRYVVIDLWYMYSNT